MPTYIDIDDHRVGVFDHGSNYLGVCNWHLLATGGYAQQDDSTVFVAAAPPGIYKTFNGFATDTNQHREFHYRFIAVPNPLILNNPPYDTDIPWRLWNTFPFGDTATVATITGSNVITSGFNVGTSLWDFEYQAQTIQVAEGEVEINAELFGDFTQGNFTLVISGLVVLSIDEFPVDNTVSEVWKWNTKVMVGWDSTEQRIRYLPAPIRSFSAEYDYDEDEIVQLQYRLYRSSLGTLAVPFWQDSFYLTGVTPALTDEIFFERDRSNVKVGDRLYIIRESDASFIPTVGVVESMTATGAILTATVPIELRAGDLACPLNSLYLTNPSFEMDQITGNFRVNGEVIDRSRTLTRDGVTQTLTTYKGLPVLDYKILAGISEGLRIEFEDLATTIGRRERSVIWTEPKILRSVAFRVNRKKVMSDYDYATLFFDYCAGQHKPFFLSSRLNDLKVRTPPPDGSSELEVNGTNYPDGYFSNAVYKQLEIEFEDGSYEWYTVNTAVAQVGGFSILTLDTALPLDVSTNPITRISYLYRVRLATDEVRVSHRNNRTIFEFSVLGTQQ